MHVDIKGVHIDVSDRMREEIERKLLHLDFAKEMITDLLFHAFLRETGSR